MQTSLLTEDLAKTVSQEVLKYQVKDRTGFSWTGNILPALVLYFFKQLIFVDVKHMLGLSAEADKVREIFVGRGISGIFLQC